MKPTLRKAVPQEEYSFILRKDTGTHMRNNWHYHPEYELLYIKNSTGTWLVGDYVGRFKSGDIILIGANLPHAFRHEYTYLTAKGQAPGESIVALFRKEMLCSPFMELPESKGIQKILQLSDRGLKLRGNARQMAAAIMQKIIKGSAGKRFIDLITIVQQLFETSEFDVLASPGYSYQSDKVDNAKISTIFEYTFNNYANPISIDEVAALVHLSKHSFCRFFKEKTKKTYTRFLMEVRIGKACRQLIEDDMTVSEACYSSGYNSISHFNHQFKTVKKKSPFEFKKEYADQLSHLYF